MVTGILDVTFYSSMYYPHYECFILQQKNTPHRHILQHHIYVMTDRYRNIYTILALYPKQREKEAALKNILSLSLSYSES